MKDYIIFTKHAKQRMLERGISMEEIQETINLPDYTINRENKIEAHKRIKDKILKIVYYKSNKFIKIITLIQK